MSDPIGAISQVSDGTGSVTGTDAGSVRASDVTNSSQELRGENFSSMAGSALKSGLKSFGQTNPIEDQRNNLLQGTSGTVGEAKGSVVSDVTRPGVAPPEASSEEPVTQLVDRLNGLYMDIAVHHVAWGVAIKMQKDMSQLLRGS